MRSRTGCLTCRQRKLKCDEVKPVCSQCRKASRECRPSDGIVFRHQQNASMNGADTPSSDSNLRGFYSYKNTFDENSIWMEIPKQITFVDVSDPYAEDIDPALSSPNHPAAHARRADLGSDAAYRSRSSEVAAHGLEALSAAASRDQYSFLPQSHASDHIMAHPHYAPYDHQMSPSPTTSRHSMLPPPSPSSINTANNNINFLLNPPNSMSPVIDPSLQSSTDHRDLATLASPTRSSQKSKQDTKGDQPVESDHEVAFLLRHFAEAPGQWMDLFDLGTYFASYVPVKALTHPLLKYAACACAAKQLGRAKGAKAIIGGVVSVQAQMEIWPGSEKVDWYWYGAKYYDKAIQLLMEVLQDDEPEPLEESINGGVHRQLPSELFSGRDHQPPKRMRLSNAKSDEVLAATAILCVYEFLDASPAWNRHLNGTKSLLDVAQVNMIPSGRLPATSRLPAKLSKARRAIFWNFARQDYLSAFINETQTRLNPENLGIWREAGLILDEDGLVRPNYTNDHSLLEGEDVMREDMISNALVWLLAKIVNFISAGDRLTLDDDDESALPQSPIGVSQQSLLERWHQLDMELQTWFDELPDTFKPCARVESTAAVPSTLLGSTRPFAEVWYSIPMCAATMQNYHFACILLLINKPHLSTARKSTVTTRLHSYRSIAGKIRFHGHEIVGISLARPEGSVRIHSLQPLFVAGQCLTEPEERRVIVELLKGIERDLGWASEYRVKQLLTE